MKIYAAVSHSRGLGLQGCNGDFHDETNNDVLIKHFEKEVNQVNKTADGKALHLKKLEQNSDETTKLDSEQIPVLTTRQLIAWRSAY